jgi:hypothetical protein
LLTVIANNRLRKFDGLHRLRDQDGLTPGLLVEFARRFGALGEYRS